MKTYILTLTTTGETEVVEAENEKQARIRVARQHPSAEVKSWHGTDTPEGNPWLDSGASICEPYKGTEFPPKEKKRL